jgi:hypothetical protein
LRTASRRCFAGQSTDESDFSVYAVHLSLLSG